MNPTQSRMARAALGWSLTEMAAASGIGRATAARYELSNSVSGDTVATIRATYEAQGVVFLGEGEASLSGGAGVRLRR